MSKIDEYWSSFFGLSVADFLEPEPKVVPHAGLQGYQGAWLFRHGTSFVISVPPDWEERFQAVVQNRVENQSPDSLTDEDFVTVFGDHVAKVIGPAYQGFLNAVEFQPVASSARLLSSADDNALHELAAACDGHDWEHSSIEAGHHPTFGVFVDGRLVAASNYRIEEQAAMPGILTHPTYRGQGLGKAVLSAATAHGLKHDFLMVYQTLVANGPAVAAAESLGYRPYATHLAVRLR